jgi:hypothetical protein
LTTRGEQTLVYDFRDRLTEVRGPGGALVASYAYDVFNRRVSRSTAGATRETVWSGWRPIEEYVAGALAERRTYGLGIDELVKVESDLGGDGTLETSWVPLYGSTGNLALARKEALEIVERDNSAARHQTRMFDHPAGRQGLEGDRRQPQQLALALADPGVVLALEHRPGEVMRARGAEKPRIRRTRGRSREASKTRPKFPDAPKGGGGCGDASGRAISGTSAPR